jgi:MFS family permease
VLYESYGFSVASLYSLGFMTGAITTPITGPLIDKFGRKRCALLYCILEIGINMLEQYPFLAGLIVSRMVGGVTTNLLSTVFETWLDTEYRKRGFDEDKYEIIMRDSVVVSNMAAIASGYLAHVLAERLGPVGPFQGAVACTVLALVVVMCVWTENYGTALSGVGHNSKGLHTYMKEAVMTFRSDSRILRVGIIQGLTVGSLQTFVFLWSPTLQAFAKRSPLTALGLDSAGEPAYGLIFGAFMAAGVAGGLCSPFLRKAVTLLLSPLAKKSNHLEAVTIEGEGEVRPMAVEFLALSCYLVCAFLLFIPCMMDETSATSFSTSLCAFLAYEFLVGVVMPCEGVIRSLYLPSDARATMMTLPRMIVNLAVSLGVILTRSIT